MGSAFSGIELGKRSLQAHSTAIQTVGHNISNASTEGYSRQRVEFRPMDPLYDPALNREERPGQIGQGVNTASITRVKDELLEGRIIAQSAGEGYWRTRDNYVLHLEKIYNEPSELSLRSKLDKFWEGWQELSVHPDEKAARLAVLERGQSLVDGIQDRYRQLSNLGRMLNDDVGVTVGQVNQIIGDISALNVQIAKVQALGDNPNDLMDRRDLLANRLADIIPITVEGARDPDEYQIHTGGVHLVQGRLNHPLRLEGDPENFGYWQVTRSDTGEPYVPLGGGKLGALLELRDGDVRGEIRNLDTFTVNLADLTNEVHAAGYGLDEVSGRAFFTEYPAVLNADGSYDRNGDGALDSTYVFRVSGTNTLNPQAQIGLSGTLTLPGREGLVTLDYRPSDTVQDVMNRINNAGLDVSVRLDRENRLQFKALAREGSEAPDFVLRHLEDSGQLLVGYAGVLAASGPAGAFSWEDPQAVSRLSGGLAEPQFALAPLAHASGWIEINSQLRADPTRIAAGLGDGLRAAQAGDGSGALAIAELRHADVRIGNTRNFDDYFAESVANVGLKGETAKISFDTAQASMKSLRDFRESLSGVNMDEEFANLIKFQHGFSATAKFISEVNTMLDTIINRMGV